ncbi:MAG: DegT/DnrJ/EryC1/StrS family aminotransferase [Magnetococcus sp. WYHC-3]
MQVPFFRHGLSPEVAAAQVRAVVETPFLTSGPVGKQVEAQLREFFAVDHALLTSSWTNGMVATLLALGIGPGDQVVVPAMTFIATANVVRLVGAEVIFADVDPLTLLLTPATLAPVLNPRVKAVIPVHLYGQMCDMPALAAFLKDWPGVLLLEDCAHCFEGRYRNTPPGIHSSAAVFSFYATKNVTCGEGGAVITRDAALAERVAQTRLHGMSAGAADRFNQGQYRHWDMVRLGTKANLPDLLAALLPEQIRHVETQRQVRQRLAETYRDAFAHLSWLRLPRWQPEQNHAHHLFPIHVPGVMRDAALTALNGAGVGATVNYRAVHTLSHYRDTMNLAAGAFPVSHSWGEGTLSLPLFPSMREEEQDYVIQQVKLKLTPLAQERGVA